MQAPQRMQSKVFCSNSSACIRERPLSSKIKCTSCGPSFSTDLRGAVIFLESMDKSSMMKISKEIRESSEDFEYQELVSISMSGFTTALYGEYEDNDCKAVQLYSYSDENQQFIFLEVIGTIDIVGLMSLVQDGSAHDLGTNLGDITNILNLDF